MPKKMLHTIWTPPHPDSPEFFYSELFTFIALLGKCPYTLVADTPYIYCLYNTTLFGYKDNKGIFVETSVGQFIWYNIPK